MNRIIRLICGLVCAAPLVACNGGSSSVKASGPSSKLTESKTGALRVVNALPAPSNIQAGSSQQIFENDLLEIDVFQVDDLDRTVRVDSRGMISMPLIGTVRAAKRSVPELEGELKSRYGKNYLQSPEITVLVKESFGQRVTMDGEFKKTGVIPITSQATLLRLVAEAGGVTPIADDNKIFVYRKFNDHTKVARYSVADIRAGKSSDPSLYGGDVVVAFTSKNKVALQNLREALGLVTSASRLAVPL